MVRHLRPLFQLRLLRSPARGTDVGRRLIFAWMVFAVLFCSLDTPVLAHAADVGASHAVMAAEGHVDFETSGSEDEESPTPDHAVHHHCPGHLLARLPAIDVIGVSERPLLFSLVAMPLASRSTAPPTEPPAA